MSSMRRFARLLAELERRGPRRERDFEEPQPAALLKDDLPDRVTEMPNRDYAQEFRDL